MSHAGSGMLTVNTFQDAHRLAALRTTFALDAPELGRMGTAYAQGLDALGFFTPTGKIGVIRIDSPAYLSEDQAVRRALAAQHRRIDDEVLLTDWSNGGSSDSTLISQLGNAVLRFHQDGITHVLFETINASEVYIFATQAESQAYHPKYGLNSTQAPQASVAALAPKTQLVGAAGVGWVPGLDVPRAGWPASMRTPRHKHCEEILVRGGVAPSSDTDYFTAYTACEQIDLLATLGKAASSPTRKALLAAMDGIGRRPFALVTPATLLSPERHDAAAAFSGLRWDATCGCFAYVGSLQPLP